MNASERLRQLPAVDEVLRWRSLQTWTQEVPRPELVQWIRAAIDDCRAAILNEHEASDRPPADHILQSLRQQRQQASGRTLQSVINATGILLHTNLGRAPLADAAMAAMTDCAAYANVELDLSSGKRSGRGERAVELLTRVTGAEDALIVNNCAAATMLVLQTLAAGREVIVSRGQLVEIGGGYRLPEVFTASGALLKEVGTTNRTYLQDYEAAIGEQTGAIIRVHRSNFYQGGFVTEPDISELVPLGHARKIPVIDDLGSGCMVDLTEFGWREPTVPHSVRSGADLTLFSGDKMFGGPQAGIIVGRKDLVAALRRSPMTRALRVDKLTIAAITATAESYLNGTARQDVPLLQMLTKAADEIQTMCQQLLAGLQVPHGIECRIVPCSSQVGGGAVPGAELESFGLLLSGSNPEKLAAALRHGRPAVLGRIHDGSVLLDLRTVPLKNVEELRRCVQSALQTSGSNG